MSLITQLIAWLRIMLGDVYAWGAQGEILTDMKDPEAWLTKVETSTANADRAIALYRKRKAGGRNPIRAYDCSGLIVKWLIDNGLIKSDMSSRGLFAACMEIKDRAELMPGDFVFRHNGVKIYHVGVYIGDGRVIESKGRDDGVVERDIDAGGKSYWNRYGRFPALQTEIKEEPKVAKIVTQSNTYSAEGLALQQMLNAYGYTSLDGKPLVEDGKAGTKTMEAFAAFKAAHDMVKTVEIEKIVNVEVPAVLPDTLSLAVSIGTAKYALELKRS